MKKLTLEQLEVRKMFAGDVQVAINGDDLVLSGDSRGNAVSVELSADQRTLSVSSLDGTTTINGRLEPAVFELRLFRDLHVTLRGGDDTLQVGSSVSARLALDEALIEMGKGNDSVLVANIDVATAMNIRTAGGIDNVRLDNVSVRDLDVDTGKGNDRIGITSCTVFGLAHLDAALGDDKWNLRNNNFRGFFDLDDS